MKKTNNNLFDTLNWILKKNGKEPDNLLDSNFILNRWLSMVSPEMAQIINTTGNRWNKSIIKLPMAKFYKLVLPKCFSKISYTKKKLKDKEAENYKEMTNSLEISSRELNFFENALEEINNCSK
jgi:hypothetical protein